MSKFKHSKPDRKDSIAGTVGGTVGGTIGRNEGEAVLDGNKVTLKTHLTKKHTT